MKDKKPDQSGGVQRWSDKGDDAPELPKPKPELEVSLPPQHDAPHVFRFECLDCKRKLTLYGRMGNWFLKALAVE